MALLQKCSVKETVIPTFVEHDMINWVMALIKKSISTKIHHFSLDFASALLANIIHAPSTLNYLSSNPAYAQHVSKINMVVNGNYAETASGQYSSVSFNAFADMSILFVKRGVL